MATLFIEVLRGYTLAGKFRVREFVVMRNHVHLLITVGVDMSIEKAVQMIKGGFSYRAKRELGYAGEIWQRGFSDVPVKDEESYLAHRSYIYENPVKVGLVDSAEEYLYGSLYLKRLKSQGAKAHCSNGERSARLKSCPDANLCARVFLQRAKPCLTTARLCTLSTDH